MSKALFILGSLAFGTSAVRMIRPTRNLRPAQPDRFSIDYEAGEHDPTFDQNPEVRVLNPPNGSRYKINHTADGANLILKYLLSNAWIDVAKVRPEKYWIQFTGKTPLGALKKLKVIIFKRTEGGIFYEVQSKQRSRSGDAFLTRDFLEHMHRHLDDLNNYVGGATQGPWEPPQERDFQGLKSFSRMGSGTPASKSLLSHPISPSRSIATTVTNLRALATPPPNTSSGYFNPYQLKVPPSVVGMIYERRIQDSDNELNKIPFEGRARPLWDTLVFKSNQIEEAEENVFALLRYYQTTNNEISIEEVRRIGNTLANFLGAHPEIAYSVSLLVDVLQRHSIFTKKPLDVRKYLAPVAAKLLQSREIRKFGH